MYTEYCVQLVGIYLHIISYNVHISNENAWGNTSIAIDFTLSNKIVWHIYLIFMSHILYLCEYWLENQKSTRYEVNNR